MDKKSKGPLLSRATHEIRAPGASYALFGNTAVEDIMKQCRWAHATTFTTFYLRDVTKQMSGIHPTPFDCDRNCIKQEECHKTEEGQEIQVHKVTNLREHWR